MLNEQLQTELDQEAKAEAKKLTGRVPIFRMGYEAGHYDGAEKYAEKWQQAQQLVERYEKALKFILKWEFPPTGQFWDIDKLQPMSYAACYGSNGERDFMRNVANEALTPKTGSDE